MHLVPEKRPLAIETADILRRQIAAGAWDAFVPPERELCARMEIGRNTLRAALEMLERDGWIGPGRSGLRRTILWKPATMPGAPPAGRERSVTFLTAYAPETLPLHTLREVDALRSAFAEAGCRFSVRTSQAFHLAEPARILDLLAQRHPSAVWILHHSTEPVQRWFAAPGRPPALVLGYPHEGVGLPFVTENMEAVARHAAGTLTAAGHRRIALLCPDSPLAGHRVVARAFRELLPKSGAVALIAPADGTVPGLRRQIDGLLARAEPPTAFVTVTIRDTVTLITHLAQLGLRVPRDASVVCLFEDPTLEYIVPEISRYRVRTAQLTRTVFRRTLELVEGRIRPAPARLMCEWVRGASVARPGGA